VKTSTENRKILLDALLQVIFDQTPANLHRNLYEELWSSLAAIAEKYVPDSEKDDG